MAKDEMTPVRCRIILALANNSMRVSRAAQFNYCPNCGAKMDGDGNG